MNGHIAKTIEPGKLYQTRQSIRGGCASQDQGGKNVRQKNFAR